MKLVLHIGTPKTGSTSLQTSCARNADWLASRGVIYPDMLSPDANHITLFYATSHFIHPFARDYGLKSEAEVGQFRARLTAHIARQRKAGAGTMLMSSENLSGNYRSPIGVQNLADMVAPLFDDIRIVVYLRRQDDAILSMYAEFMRRGFSELNFPEFLDTALGPMTMLPYLDYSHLLSQWVAAFGRAAIEVRLFERARAAKGGLIADFLAMALGPGSALDGFAHVPELNISPSAPALEFLRRLHPYVPNRKNGVQNPVRERLRRRIDQLPADPRPQMSAAQSDRILSHFAEANRWLGKNFFSGEQDLFPRRTDLPAESNIGEVGLDDFARFTSILLG